MGRDGECRAVVEAMGATGARARVLLVTGDAGMGKTTVVEQARRTARGTGVRVVRLGWEGCEDTAEVVLASGQGRSLVVRNLDDSPLRLTAARRARVRAAARHGEMAGLSALSEALAEASRQEPYALVVDGVERMPRRVAEAWELLLRFFRPRGVPVVMAGRTGSTSGPGGARLAAAADRVLALAPLRRADAAALVAAVVTARFGRPAGLTLADAVSRVLGTLAGNPRAVLSVLGSLDERDLTEVDGQMYLTAAEDRLRLATDPAELIRFAWPEGPPDAGTVGAAILTAHAVERAEVRLEDALRLSSAEEWAIKRRLDRLVADRVLSMDEEGRLSFTVPALGAALSALPTRHDVPGLSARFVTSVTDLLGAECAGGGHPRLADHAAVAGPRLDDGLAVPLLLAAAREDTRADWTLSARAYAEALRRLAPRDRRTPGVLQEASGLSLRHGDHAGLLALGEPLLACLNAPHPGQAGKPAGLEAVIGAWVLAALNEHRSPYVDDADPRYRAVLERLPAAAELAALGGLYGIGSLTSRPTPAPGPGDDSGVNPGTGSGADTDSGSGTVPGTGPGAEPGVGPGRCSGPVLSPAELRLVAAAVGSRAGLRRARQALPPDAIGEQALERLREAAAYGDLAGAFAAVLGDRYVTAGDSVATRYRAMARDYLAGDWDAALTAARRIEVRGRSNDTVGAAQSARALAAEIHCLRGDVVRARTWLEPIPVTAGHPLVARAKLSVRYWSGRQEEALEGAWHDVRQARERGLLAGVERVLLHVMSFASLDDRPHTVRQALEELEALHDEAASPLTREAVLIGRAMAHHDADSALTAYRSLNQRGDIPLRVRCCLSLVDTADDPRPWLSEAARDAHRLGLGRPVRTELIRAAQRRNISLPRLRTAREELTEHDVTLVRMVSDGATNRQIAIRLACSEKTVEQRLTRLFQRTACRSRAELAAAWLDGSLTRLGILPEDAAGTGT
ncbi:AAA family ATPase [Streptomyces antibioticus]|uniref:helix-turn-helix transcriptional regulator n=1 Tax=Streptomyces antibioticus TaxID=1890 RepID=UPI0036D1DEFA